MVYVDPAERFGEGRCVNCGLLSLIRVNGAVEEMAMAFRVGWQQSTDPPRCLIYQRHLSEELNEFTKSTGKLQPAGVSEIIRRDQECDSWYGYVEGLSPQQHLQRRDMMELEKTRRAQAKMLADIDQRSQDLTRDVLREQKEIAAEHAKTAEAHRRIFAQSDLQNDRYNRRFWWIAMIALVVALVPLLFPNGLPWIADRLDGADSPRIVVLATPTPAPPTPADSQP